MLLDDVIEFLMAAEGTWLTTNAKHGHLLCHSTVWWLVDYVVKAEDLADACWEGCGTPF